MKGDTMKHNYFTVCEYCGANLDPGEKCDCRGEDRKEKPPSFFQAGPDREQAQAKEQGAAA